jgi:hypothetical protein
MSARGLAVALAGAILAAGRARAQEPETHPGQLLRTWAHLQMAGPGAQVWSLIRFDADGRYRALRVAPGDSANPGSAPVTGLWAVVKTEVRGSLLCTRVDGAEGSRCNNYTLDPDGRRLVWKDVDFTVADTALVHRLGLKDF